VPLDGVFLQVPTRSTWTALWHARFPASVAKTFAIEASRV
jgi:hypothetical protein